MAELETEKEKNANLKKKMETLNENFNEKNEAEIVEYKQKIIDFQMERQQLIKLSENGNQDASIAVSFIILKHLSHIFFR